MLLLYKGICQLVCGWSVCVRAEREKGGRPVSVENPDICVHTNVPLSPWNPDSTFITRPAEALLYLIFTLVWLLITYQNCVCTQQPNKTTHFTACKKASRVTCHTAVLTHCQWYFSGFGASRVSSWQLWRQKHKCQNRDQDCFQRVFYLSQEKKKKPTGWKMEHNKLSPFWKTSIWESSTI